MNNTNTFTISGGSGIINPGGRLVEHTCPILDIDKRHDWAGCYDEKRLKERYPILQKLYTERNPEIYPPQEDFVSLMRKYGI